MPRTRRLQIPGVVHHVMSRAIDRISIFDNADNCRFFLTRLGTLLNRFGTRCYAWALMPTHYHLVLAPLRRDLDRLMQRLNAPFAVRVNKCLNRRGYLFDNRYKSLLVFGTPYFMELIRYVHLNPVRAGLLHTLDELDTYEWTSHYDIAANRRHPWTRTDDVLNLFGTTVDGRMGAYRSYLQAGIEEHRQNRDTAGHREAASLFSQYNCRAIGEPEPVRTALMQEALREDRRRALRQSGVTIAAVAGHVGSTYGLSADDLRRPARACDRSRARALVAFTCQEYLGSSLAQIGDFLSLSPSAASRACLRGGKVREAEPLRLGSVLRMMGASGPECSGNTDLSASA